MFNDVNDNTHWRLLGEKTTKGDLIAAASLPILPANGATGKGDTTIDAEYVAHIDHTNDEHEMGTGILVGELAHSSVLFAGAHVRAPGDVKWKLGATEAFPVDRSTPPPSFADGAFAEMRVATGVIYLGVATNKFDGVEREDYKDDAGTIKNDSLSASFGMQPCRYVYSWWTVFLELQFVWNYSWPPPLT